MLKFSGTFKSFCLLAVLACIITSSTAKSWGADDDWDDDWLESEESGEQDPPAKSSDDHSNHNNHDHHQRQMSAPKANWDENPAGGGMQSSNYAGHNETCGPTRKSCISEQNLVCSDADQTGRCICAPGYIYVRATETCWVIPKSNEDTCHHDVQCHAGKWGALARCSKHTTKCECYDYSTNGKRETAQVDGVCYIQKSPGDLCNSHEECDKPIKGGAFCQGGNYTGDGGSGNYTGSCQCRDTHMWYNPLKSCLKKATELNDECVITSQCRQGTLGIHSMCVGERSHCECHIADNTTEPVYYKALKKCFPKKAYNETCDEDDDCRASLGPDVLCGETEEYPNDKVCHCPKGKVCRSSGFSNILGASSPYTMGVACMAAVIGMTISMNGLGEGMQMTSSGGW